MPSGGKREGQIDWTPERVDLLRRLWKEKVLSAIIAEKIGHPGKRNAVISKAHRLKLDGINKRQYRNPGRRLKAPPTPQPVPSRHYEYNTVPVVRVAQIGFQHRRFEWELNETTSAERP